MLSVFQRVAGVDDVTAGTGGKGTPHCVFCGGRIGSDLAHLLDDSEELSSCALCYLVRHLDRPRIDDEALLIWLPEMSQPALHCLMRTIHCRLRVLGETLDVRASPLLDTEDRPVLWHAQQALLGRTETATARLGSARPSDLADALLRLSAPAYQARRRSLGGLRLLPRGHFFAGDSDVYSAIVDAWRNLATDAAPSPPGAAGEGG